MERSSAPAEKLIPANLRPSQAAPQETPRPWPPAPTRSSALAVLARGQAEATTRALVQGPVLLAGPEEKDDWSATATPDGWKVPRNPSRTPVRPRDPFEVQAGTDDLGPLRIVSSAGGRIRALRLQWPEEFQDPAFSAQKAVFHDLFTRLPPDVVMHIVAEGLAAPALPGIFAEWSVPNRERIHIHPMHLRSTADTVYSPMTMWARDGAVLARCPEGRDVLLLPNSFRGDGQVDPKLNRLQIQGTGAAPGRLAQALPDLLVRRTGLSFEGGDVIANRRHVLLGYSTVHRNMTELRLSRDAVVERFRDLFGLPILVIEPQPEFHLDLGFTFLDDQTVAVADPGEGIRLAGRLQELQRLVQATRDKRVGEWYDRAARWLGDMGYRVVRLPSLCGLGLTTPYLTYNNVLLEHYAGVKRVYMPVYDAPLDEAARAVYRSQGFQVRDMPSARVSTMLWGAIRCATGELQVSDAP